MKRYLSGQNADKGTKGPQFNHLGQFFLRALNVEAGEEKAVGLNLLQSFFIGMPRLFTMTAANALYLNYFGSENLPYVYMAVAVVVPIVGLAHLQLEKKLTFGRHVAGTLLFLAAVQAVLLGAVKTPFARWASLCALIWFTAEWVLTNAAFWNVANRMFTVRQAKRVFGLIGTGEVLAMILGGAVTPVLADRFGAGNLLAFSMAGNLLAFFNFRFLSRLLGRAEEAGGEESQAEEDKPKGGLSAMVKNRYILLAFGIVSFIYIAFYFVDNAFYQQVESRYEDAGEMAGFLGKFFSVFGVFNFVVKTFVSGKALARFGVRGGLLAAPVSIALGCGLVVSGGVFGLSAGFIFFCVSLTKLLEGTFVDAITRPAYYTLFQPLPQRLRASSQNAAESVVAQFAGGLAGVALLVLNKAFSFTAVGLCGTLLAFVAGWAAVSVAAGAGYRKAISDALSRRRGAGGEISLSDPAAILALEKGLWSRRPGEVIYCLNSLNELRHSGMREFLKRLFEHPDGEVRGTAYQIAEKNGAEELFEPLRAHLDEEGGPRVKGSALRALAAAGGMDAFDLVSGFLEDSDDEIRLAAIVGLIRHCGIEGAVRAGHRLMGLEASENPADRRFAAKALGQVGAPNFYRGLLALLNDPDLSVRSEAIDAAGRLRAPKLWPLVAGCLADDRVKARAVRALVKGGAATIPALEEAFAKGGAALRIRIARVMGRIGGEKAVAFLKKNLGGEDVDVLHQVLLSLKSCGYRAGRDDRNMVEGLIEKEAAYSVGVLASLVDIGDDGAVSLLGEALRWEMEKSRERIFLLLSFIYNPRNIQAIWSHYSESSAEKRAFALELFETTVEAALKAKTLPLLEDAPDGVRLKKMSSLFPSARSDRPGRLREIAFDGRRWKNPWVRMCALDAAWRAGVEGLAAETARLAEETPDVPLAAEAAGVLERKGQGRDASAGMESSIMEKVKVLKTARMFSRTPGETLAQVAGILKGRAFRAGETICEKGDMGDAMCLIAKGRVRVYDGDKTLAGLGAGEIFGELSALSSEPRSASVEAEEDGFIFTIAQQALYELIGERIEAAKGIIQDLCRRLQDLLAARTAEAPPPAPGAPPASAAGIKKDGGRPETTLGSVEKVIFLKSAGIFSETPDAVLAGAADFAREIVLEKGETLFEKGRSGRVMYVIVEGKLRVFDGDRTIAELESGAPIGELAALSSEPRTASVVALEETRLLSLDQTALYDLMWEQNEVVRGVIQVLVQRLRASRAN